MGSKENIEQLLHDIMDFKTKLEIYIELIKDAKDGHLKGCVTGDTASDVVDTCRCHYQLNIYPKKLLKEIIFR